MLPYESYTTSKGRGTEACTLEGVSLTSRVFQIRIGKAIMTIASPPVHISSSWTRRGLLKVEKQTPIALSPVELGVYGNVPGGEGGRLAQRSLGRPWY